MGKKYIITSELQKLIDWNTILPLARCARGHDIQMVKLFKNSKIIAHYHEGDYQGIVATCVQLEDGRYVIYNDYYGSCCGCDSWEDASDDEVIQMCKDLANGAYVFENLNDVIEFLETKDKERHSWNEIAIGLLKEIKNPKIEEK